MKLLARLAAVLILAAIITATVQACKTHRCTDATHYTCDGVCSCDGLECK